MTLHIVHKHGPFTTYMLNLHLHCHPLHFTLSALTRSHQRVAAAMQGSASLIEEQLRVQCLARGHSEHADSWRVGFEVPNLQPSLRDPLPYQLSRSRPIGHCLALAAPQ